MSFIVCFDGSAHTSMQAPAELQHSAQRLRPPSQYRWAPVPGSAFGKAIGVSPAFAQATCTVDLQARQRKLLVPGGADSLHTLQIEIDFENSASSSIDIIVVFVSNPTLKLVSIITD